MSTAQTSDDREAISEMPTGRLSVYLRCLESLDETTISSRELADRFHLNAAQIRKDLAHFGEFGIRGVGYNVGRLKEHLIRTLGIDRPRHAVIVGAGSLVMALADYKGSTARASWSWPSSTVTRRRSVRSRREPSRSSRRIGCPRSCGGFTW